MSAIGDYIYLTYKGYIIGNDNDKLNHADVKLSNAMSAIEQKRADINNVLQKADDKKTAKKMQDVFNLYTYQAIPENSNMTKTEVENIHKEFIQNMQEMSGRIVSNNLGILQTKASVAMGKELRNELDTIVNKLQKQSNENGNIKKQLENFLNFVQKNQKFIDRIQGDSNDNTVPTNVGKEIAILKDKIDSYSKALKNKNIDKKLLKKQEDNLLQLAMALYDRYSHVPAYALSIGDLGEAAVRYMLMKGLSLAEDVAVNIVGGEGGQAIMKKTDYLQQNPSIKPEDLKDIVITQNGEEYIVIGQNKTQDKVDITFNLNGEDINLSVKNYSANEDYDIKILSGGNLYSLLQAENDSKFIEHYINLLEIKKDIPPGSNDREMIENSQEKQKAIDVMNRLILLKALSGYNVFKAYDGAVKSMSVANFMVVNLRGKKGKGQWYVETLKEAHQKAMQSSDNYVITNKQTGQNTVYPFANVAKEEVKELLPQTTIINERISRVIASIHKTNLDVAIRKKAFNL